MTGLPKRKLLRGGGALVLFSITVTFWRKFQMPGHNPGDDFALYVNQAKSLVQGNVGETLASNHFAVDNSSWHSFSPYSYPWGFPLLLAPMMLIKGTVNPVTGVDYDSLKLVVTLCFAVAIYLFHRLLHRRMHWLGAVLLPTFFGLNYWYVKHTDQVLSELPFLMTIMVFLAWIDRLRIRKELDGLRRGPLIVLGFLAWFSFNTRREGLGLLVGLLLAQVAVVAQRWHEDPHVRPWVRIRWNALATPWLSFLGFTGMMQLILPSDLLPKYDERNPSTITGVSRVTGNVRFYGNILAEQLGLKDEGPKHMELFHRVGLGGAVLAATLGFAVIGVVVGCIRRPHEELPIAGASIGVGAAVMVSPFSDYRYLLALTPFVVYFAYQGVTIPARALFRVPAKWPVAIAEVALVAFIVGGSHDTKNAFDYHTTYRYTQPGPQEKNQLDMFDAVRRYTKGTSIIVFNRARTMTLYTGRLSVQGNDLHFTERAGDYYAMYLEPDGTPGSYSQYALTDKEAAATGFVKIWSNPQWVLWKNPDVSGRKP